MFLGSSGSTRRVGQQQGRNRLLGQNFARGAVDVLDGHRADAVRPGLDVLDRLSDGEGAAENTGRRRIGVARIDSRSLEPLDRPDARRVGKEWASSCRCRVWTFPYKKTPE